MLSGMQPWAALVEGDLLRQHWAVRSRPLAGTSWPTPKAPPLLTWMARTSQPKQLMRRKDNPKAPNIDVLSRHYLQLVCVIIRLRGRILASGSVARPLKCAASCGGGAVARSEPDALDKLAIALRLLEASGDGKITVEVRLCAGW